MKATLKLENGKEIKVDITDEQVEELAVPKDYGWKPEVGDHYYVLDSAADVGATDWINSQYDNEVYELGNVFRTQEEAEKARDWLKAFRILREDAGRFKADKAQWYVYYSDHALTYSVTYRRQALLYFDSPQDAYVSIENHYKEWKILLGVDDD